ncbi:MAG: hypothetical protein U0074_01240 [Kouleothrix sp.]
MSDEDFIPDVKVAGDAIERGYVKRLNAVDTTAPSGVVGAVLADGYP